MHKQFHLSIGVRSIDESVNFFDEIFNAKVNYRDPSGGYVNIDFFGSQVTLKPLFDINPEMQELHFGINLNLAEFDRLAKKILQTGNANIISGPKVVDADTPLERKKMYVKCPTGYIFEIKGFK